MVIEVDNQEGKLLPGMTANVSIITGKKEDILTVPNVALKFTTDDNTKRYDKKGIWIDKKGKPVRVNVETGVSDDTYSEIISDEIKEGDIVYTRNLSSGKKPQQMRVPRI